MPVVSTLEANQPVANPNRASNPTADPFDRLAAVIVRVTPFSWRAAAVAVIALLCGAVLQLLVVLTAGPGIPFAGFFPAIAIAAIVAGVPAGIGVCFGATILVWWAVREPHFTFHAMSVREVSETAWLLGCGLILAGFGLLCRKLLERAYKRQQAMNVLVRELEHRRANTFAVLRAITARTLQREPELAGRLLRRFEAIRRTNDLLTEQPEGALLTTIFRNELEGFTSEQVALNGTDVMLPAEQTRNLILVVHELLTNAVKYGALSVGGGQLRITWRVLGKDLSILWEELGGPIISPPDRRGFGTSLIEHCIAQVGGTWEPGYEATGFRCRILLPFDSERPR